jgi:phage portal protein BeeE
MQSGVISPNEARFKENYPPVPGGESPMVQEQNYSLAALAKRDALDNPFGAKESAKTPAPAESEETAAESVDPEKAAAHRLVIAQFAKSRFGDRLRAPRP